MEEQILTQGTFDGNRYKFSRKSYNTPLLPAVIALLATLIVFVYIGVFH